MADFLRVVLYGVLPAFAAALLLVGAFGPRLLGCASGVGLLAAFALLRRWPAWPHDLYAGSNDGNQWLVWSVFAIGVLTVAGGGKVPPRLLQLPGGALLLSGQAWLMTITRRARASALEGYAGFGIAAVALVVLWWSVRRAVMQRGGAAMTWLLTACLVGDSVLLLLGGSALQGQLAGAVAAAFGTAAGTALWRRPFQLDRAVALVFAAAHGGLLFAGVQFSDLQLLPAALAAAAPVALQFAGPRADGARAAGRHALCVTAMLAAIGGAVALVLAAQP